MLEASVIESVIVVRVIATASRNQLVLREQRGESRLSHYVKFETWWILLPVLKIVAHTAHSAWK